MAPKRLISIFEAAIAAGFEEDETKDGHPRLTPPKGLIDPYTQRPAAPITFGKTPSDHRGDKNQVALLRRLGVDLPHKGRTPKKEDRK